MISDKTVLAVVPARGGSKGVPLKNLHPVGGVPIVAMAGHCLKNVPAIDRKVVSTDHEGIAATAEAAGLAAPFRRPAELSGDRIGDWDVLHHALLEMEAIDHTTYDIVMMIQPTAPLRTPEQVTQTLEYFIAGEWDAVWTVSETDLTYHPKKQFCITDSALSYYDPTGSKIVARQELEPVYHCNGVAYAYSRECLTEQKTKMGRRTGAIVIEGPAVSIDTLEDFELVERVMAAKSSSAVGVD